MPAPRAPQNPEQHRRRPHLDLFGASAASGFCGCEKMEKRLRNYRPSREELCSRLEGGEQKSQRVPGLPWLAAAAEQQTWQLATSRRRRQHLCLSTPGRERVGVRWSQPRHLGPPPDSVWPASQDDLRPGLKLQGLSHWAKKEKKKSF